MFIPQMRVCMQVLTYRYILQMHTAAFVKTRVGTTKMRTRAYVHSHVYERRGAGVEYHFQEI